MDLVVDVEGFYLVGVSFILLQFVCLFETRIDKDLNIVDGKFLVIGSRI